ncbi:MAG: hypothetical protein ACK58T_13000, partial [Phycisphaerae bacterium]
LPADAVRDGAVDRNKKWARVVYAYENGKSRVFPVAVGPSDLTDTVILKGLDESTKIIVGPFKALVSLKADQKLTDQEEKKKGAADANANVRTASNDKADPKVGEKAPEKPADKRPD